MVHLAREYGAKPILIMPPVNYHWEPGIRSVHYKVEFEEALANFKGKIRENLEEAIEQFSLGNYAKALELDLVLPRIKERYRLILKEIAEETGIDLIDIQESILECHFADYCHPLQEANQLIVNQFFEICGTREFKRKVRPVRLRWRILEKAADWLGPFIRTKNDKDSQPPDDIYSMF